MANENDSKKSKDQSPKDLILDYRAPLNMPAWARRALEAQLAIDAEDAKSAGQLGFMARALVLASMPYKDPKLDVFKRVNGDFSLRIVAGYEGGIPFGIYPRLLINWITTEAVITKSPVIELGNSLSSFLSEVLDLRRSGGSRGTHQRVNEQIKRTFGAMISAQYTGGLSNRRVHLRNVMIADALDYDDSSLKLGPDATGNEIESAGEDANNLWVPQPGENAGQWRSTVKLTDNFFQECIANPVPIDRRAYIALRNSPLAMDLYTWLSYRFSYIKKPSAPIPWVALMGQFGSNYNSANHDQAVRDFKRNFLQALKMVLTVYPNANVDAQSNGLVLNPSKPHIAPRSPSKRQPSLF